MSIWVTTHTMGDHEEENDLPGTVLSYADGWSNHYPNTTGNVETPAVVHLASVAPWCVPGHDVDGPDGSCTSCKQPHDAPESGEWVRLSVEAPNALTWWDDDHKPQPAPVHADVVLDEQAARSLAQVLLDWANSPKIKQN